ncbi:LOW QUALITY PROTEIN: Subtilisin-like protease, fibronectin type-III domain [Dillenia turbinata]|uniref:Subtilisin-like protease, fibronectin type-III domain n=1 Tax=Dillenia turbinata TaxID=194707 RepID=A0AAN8ZAL3_9MAGN
MNASNNNVAEFAYGADHINPSKGVNPGLAYDADESDCVNFLWRQGYSTDMLRLVSGDNSVCSYTKSTSLEFKLPYFHPLWQKEFVTCIFHRTVTNVGSPVSSYKAIVIAATGVQVRVKPNVLSLKSLGRKQSFSATVTTNIAQTVLSSSLVWDDGVHNVRSPIVAYATSWTLQCNLRYVYFVSKLRTRWCCV